MIAYASFERAESIVVLHAVSGEDVHVAVIAHDWNADDERAVGPLQTRGDILVEGQFCRGGLELFDCHLVGGAPPLNRRHDKPLPLNSQPLSSRRPGKTAAAEQVKMDMKHRLSGVLAAVDDDAKTVVGNA